MQCYPFLDKWGKGKDQKIISGLQVQIEKAYKRAINSWSGSYLLKSSSSLFYNAEVESSLFNRHILWCHHLYLNEVSINSEAVQGKSSSFIAAEDIHACHFFNGCHPFCNGTLIKWMKPIKQIKIYIYIYISMENVCFMLEHTNEVSLFSWNEICNQLSLKAFVYFHSIKIHVSGSIFFQVSC